jgi:hypothetical protein
MSALNFKGIETKSQSHNWDVHTFLNDVDTSLESEKLGAPTSSQDDRYRYESLPKKTIWIIRYPYDEYEANGERKMIYILLFFQSAGLLVLLFWP